MSMYDCDKEVRKFHGAKVKLSEETRNKLLRHAEANENRLKKGLEEAKKPMPKFFVLQGSQAMRTGVQHPENDYDIDDGVVFTRESLKGAQGADKTALDARKMVCDALQDEIFKKQPEIRTNCVRVYYNEGHNVDVPVYRVENPDSESTVYELASVDWKKSNPEGVTKWFSNQLDLKASPKESSHQMRRLVRMLKSFANSRDSWNMPSGFALTVLTNESYYAHEDRDDHAFYQLLKRIKNRLEGSKDVYHPVLTSEKLNSSDDPCMSELKDRLTWAINELEVTQKSDCTRKAALKAWKSVFNTDFFDDMISEEESAKASSYAVLNANPSKEVDKHGGGRFG
jgi:hypothetical protein